MLLRVRRSEDPVARLLTVASVPDGCEADRLRVKPGWRLLAVDGEVNRLFLSFFLSFRATQSSGQSSGVVTGSW